VWSIATNPHDVAEYPLETCCQEAVFEEIKMSELIEVIEGRYGVAGWVSAQPSNLKIDGVPRIEFGFNGKLPLHVDLGGAMKVVRELRTAGFDARADKIDDIIRAMGALRADQPRLVIRHGAGSP
jgi:hypothetical protein